MTTKNKRKGSQWETDVCDYLKSRWPKIERRHLSGNQDKGDIINFAEDFILECKNEQTITLSQYMKEVEVEKRNAGTRFGAAVVKARRKATSQAYVVMSLEDFAILIGEWET